MNGRIYDPLLGRMLSADLVVTYPSSLQSYNRYAYVLNNPLTMVDPSGFNPMVCGMMQPLAESQMRQQLGAAKSERCIALNRQVDVTVANSPGAAPFRGAIKPLMNAIGHGLEASKEFSRGDTGTPVLDKTIGTLHVLVAAGDVAGFLLPFAVMEQRVAAEFANAANAAADQTTHAADVAAPASTPATEPVDGNSVPNQTGGDGTISQQQPTDVPAEQSDKHFSGTDKAWASGATPNSKYTQVHPEMQDKAIQTSVYDENGDIVGQVDHKEQHGQPPGHGHVMETPGDIGSGHQGAETALPPEEVPEDWKKLPPGVTPIHS